MQKNTFNIFILFTLSLFFQPVYGFERLDEATITTMFKEWESKANQGDAEAQSALGHSYKNGFGVKQDYFKAVNWFQKAANQGDAKAQFFLGFMYLLKNFFNNFI
jgi:TPR repeat protein